MTCSTPIPWEDLVAYWAHDLPLADVDRVDEHLMSCATCSAESERIAPIAEWLRVLLPMVITRSMVDKLRARGTRLAETTFSPGRTEVVFRRDLDVMIHRLAGFDLSTARRVRVTVRVESTGEIIQQDTNAPFDARDGVLVSCQRHFQSFPSDIVMEVCAIDAAGAESRAVYALPHVIER